MCNNSNWIPLFISVTSFVDREQKSPKHGHKSGIFVIKQNYSDYLLSQKLNENIIKCFATPVARRTSLSSLYNTLFTPGLAVCHKNKEAS